MHFKQGAGNFTRKAVLTILVKTGKEEYFEGISIGTEASPIHLPQEDTLLHKWDN